MVMKKKWFKCIAVCLIFLFSFTTVYATPARVENSSDIHFNATVVDTHSDTLMKIINRTTWIPENDIGVMTTNQMDIQKLQLGGVDVQTFGAYTSGYLTNGQFDYARSNSRILALINGLKWTINNNPDSIEQLYNLKDIERIVKDGKIAALSSIEGAYSLNEENAIELVRQYYDLGVRMLALNWSVSNVLGEGVNELYKDGTPSSGGLTDLGKEVIEEMNRLGMVVDVSHMNVETFWEAVETSNAPIIASHSGSMSMNTHVRNLDDDQIRAIAKTGGVVQVVFYPLFLNGTPDNQKCEVIEDLVDHIDYIVNLVGVDYVGLGSDFDGASMGTDLANSSMVPNITSELLERGYTKIDIEKILGENSLRVFKDAWRKASANVNNGTAPSIEPLVVMGQKVDKNNIILSAEVNTNKGSKLDIDSLKVIVDGIVYEPTFDKESSVMSVTVTESLMDKFHVVTFESANSNGSVSREARIFYIE